MQFAKLHERIVDIKMRLLIRLAHKAYFTFYISQQEEDMKRNRNLLTVREKQRIVNYCLERRELTPLT
jgi:hypothetical protein